MKLTIEDKIKIIELRAKGLGCRTIAKLFKVRKSTIENIWHRYEKHGIEGIKHPTKNALAHLSQTVLARCIFLSFSILSCSVI